MSVGTYSGNSGRMRLPGPGWTGEAPVSPPHQLPVLLGVDFSRILISEGHAQSPDQVQQEHLPQDAGDSHDPPRITLTVNWAGRGARRSIIHIKVKTEAAPKGLQLYFRAASVIARRLRRWLFVDLLRNSRVGGGKVIRVPAVLGHDSVGACGKG